jgi:hypothetical protein
MSSFTFPIKSQSSLFPSSDIPNEKFIQVRKAYQDRYKDIVLPPNLLAGKWIVSPNKKIKVMTDIEFKISYYGEMIDFDEKWVLSLIKKENINLLVYEIQELIEYIVRKNKVNTPDTAIESLVRRNMSRYVDNVLDRIWKHQGKDTQDKFWDLWQNLYP